MEQEQAPDHGSHQHEHEDNSQKNELITTDDGLDQAIQRAIAQHDLEQQQLEQQQGHSHADAEMMAQHAASEAAQLHPNGTETGGYSGENDVGAQASGTPSPEVDMDVDLGVGSMPGSPLLNAAQEKEHLQMIADELNRAATDQTNSRDPGMSQSVEIKGESNDFDGMHAEGDENDEGGLSSGEIPPGDMESDSSQSHNIHMDQHQIHQEHRHQDDQRGHIPNTYNVPHHESPGRDARSVDPTINGPYDGQKHPVSSAEDTSTNEPAKGEIPAAGSRHTASETVSASTGPLSGLSTTHIPADSELLATNSAIAAYNALSSQLPPAASIANAHLAALPLPIVPTSYMPARIQLLVSTLAVLDNLATQLLRVFAIGPYQKIIDLASSPDTAPGAAFRDLTSLFEFTKRLYSEEDPFLTVEHIAPGIWKEGEKTPTMFRSREQTIESTLRKVNLATFLAATLGTIEVGFFHLNESFLTVFCPANDLDPANSMSNMSASNMNLQSGSASHIGEKCGKILKPQAGLYLDLKTQAYISAIEAGERSREEILEDILPSNLEQVLQERRGTKVLSPTEIDFVHRCISRKEMLLNYAADQNLNEEYEWFEFLKELFEFVSKNMGFLLWGKRGKLPNTKKAASHSVVIDTTGPKPSSTPHSDQVLQQATQSAREQPVLPTRNEGKGLDDLTAALLPSEIQEQQIHLRINPSVNSKGPSRRPWTRQEEKALRHAMELKGTQWSVILELFGQGGRINESLKNRTQVQLKDKARNWKMFFLKSGLAVPSYLQKVTGDLDREDKSKAKSARNKKTAAAPVPTMPKRDNVTGETAVENIDEELRKKRRVK